MKKRILFCSAIIFFIALTSFPLFSFATLGVGVGAGKIIVDKPLKAGVIYALPNLPVINTGDQLTSYGVSVEYLEQIPELRPAKEWFVFSPSIFELKPGEVKNVAISLNIPLKVKPGNYFAFLEAHPIVKEQAGITQVGIAAAAKLYFTISPANVFQGIYYRISSLVIKYSPWSYIIPLIIVLAVILSVLKKFIKIDVKFNKK
jgi:hypothetical protein